MVDETPSEGQEAKPENQAGEQAPEGEAKEKTIGEQLKEEGLIEEPEGDGMKEQEITVFDLNVRIDKLEGKLDLTKEMLNSQNERLGDIVERIGDLRRMVLDREKASTSLETNFEKISVIVKDLDPEVIIRRFEKFKGDIDKQNTLIEKMNTILDVFEGRIKKMEERFSAIKGFENLVEIIQKITAGMKRIEESKQYADRMAAKIEAVFSETKKTLSQIASERDTITKLATLTRSMVKDIDKLELRYQEDTIKKNEIDTIKADITKAATGISSTSFAALQGKVALIELEVKSTPDLQEELVKTKNLMEKAEGDHAEQKISDRAYDELKAACDKKIAKIESILNKRSATVPPPNAKATETEETAEKTETTLEKEQGGDSKIAGEKIEQENQTTSAEKSTTAIDSNQNEISSDNQKSLIENKTSNPQEEKKQTETKSEDSKESGDTKPLSKNEIVEVQSEAAQDNLEKPSSENEEVSTKEEPVVFDDSTDANVAATELKEQREHVLKLLEKAKADFAANNLTEKTFSELKKACEQQLSQLDQKIVQLVPQKELPKELGAEVKKEEEHKETLVDKVQHDESKNPSKEEGKRKEEQVENSADAKSAESDHNAGKNGVKESTNIEEKTDVKESRAKEETKAEEKVEEKKVEADNEKTDYTENGSGAPENKNPKENKQLETAGENSKEGEKKEEPKSEAKKDENHTHLQKALEQLPVSHRKVLVLHTIQKVPLGSVAESLGLAEDQVERILEEAKEKLLETINQPQQEENV